MVNLDSIQRYWNCCFLRNYFQLKVVPFCTSMKHLPVFVQFHYFSRQMQFELSNVVYSHENLNERVGEMCDSPFSTKTLWNKIGEKKPQSCILSRVKDWKNWWERWMDWSLRCYWSQREKKIEETNGANSTQPDFLVKYMLIYFTITQHFHTLR